MGPFVQLKQANYMFQQNTGLHRTAANPHPSGQTHGVILRTPCRWNT